MNQKLWKEAYNRLTIYGDIPPAVCWSRLATEEQALRDTNAIQIFSILGKLEEEARKMSSVFYVAGTISSSFAAWLFGGTKVNPLPPHYRCPKCGKTEFVTNTADAICTGNDIRCMTSEQCWNWQKTYPSSVSFTLVPSTLADNIQSAQKKLGTNIVDSQNPLICPSGIPTI